MLPEWWYEKLHEPFPSKTTITKNYGENYKTKPCKVSGNCPKGIQQIYSKKSTKSQNSGHQWQLNFDLLTNLPPRPAQCDGSAILGGCGQKDGAPSTISFQARDSQREQAASTCPFPQPHVCIAEALL